MIDHEKWRIKYVVQKNSCQTFASWNAEMVRNFETIYKSVKEIQVSISD
jgi:hypothetical protein